MKRYKAKRDFRRTPEPKGRAGRTDASVRRFVVQKHQASHLHYDLRLEFGGTLKSWAVPKGPSTDPGERRLAMHVEDHPIGYLAFAGVIPPGNYGAGTVEIWDEGTYGVPGASSAHDLEAIMAKKYANGELTFELRGKKLNGLFTLVRTSGSSMAKSGKDPWLLIKRRDPVTPSDKAKTVSPHRRKRKTKSGRDPFPRDLKPMFARTAHEPFSRDGWIFEMKWDGYRAIAEIERGEVRLHSRERLLMNDRYPRIVRDLSRIPHDAVVDGEIVVLDARGRPDFQALQEYGDRPDRPIRYLAFDLLYVDGEDLRARPLVERKERLRELLPRLDHVAISEHVAREGKSLFLGAEMEGLEGVMAKRTESPYLPGTRSADWLKFKTVMRQEAVVGGYTEPRGSRKHVGALVLGVYDRGGLVYIGHSGGGSDEAVLRRLDRMLKPIERKTSPFVSPPKPNAPVHWVEPRVVVEVKFREWTRDGVMRQPVLLGIREDKAARDVVKETPEALADDPIGFSNADKVFWPNEGMTKGDLLKFYLEIAPTILPYLKDRPLSLRRYPDGIEGADFFQKDVPEAPSSIRTVDLPSESKGKTIRFVLGDDIPTLAYLVQLGCIEMNPWNSRLADLDRPDYAVIDIDPVEVPFTAAVEVARAVKDVLDAAGATGVCKTSGGRGLHVYVPFGAKYTYEHARLFAELVAHLVRRRLPKLVSLERSPAKRQGKVYIDFPQNKRGATTASAYSVRPRPGAPVSTPLRWREVNARLDPAAFTIATLPERIRRVGDLWMPVLGPGIDVEACLKNLEKASR